MYLVVALAADPEYVIDRKKLVHLQRKLLRLLILRHGRQRLRAFGCISQEHAV